MQDILDVESTLTERYQTTIPASVREVLHLKKHDKINYTIRPNGEVVLSRATPESGSDPLVARFLEFLVQDAQLHPERIKGMDEGFVNRIRSLVGHIEVDLDEALSPDDE